jgi:hypothetical protein
MVSRCERLINVVKKNKPKMLRGLSQKALWRVKGLNHPLSWAKDATGGVERT